jgi:hypothetical protein
LQAAKTNQTESKLENDAGEREREREREREKFTS